MSAPFLRNVIPVLTAVAATFYLATAVPHELPSPEAAPPAVARAEVQRCVANGRDADECLDEADGKALVERADWLARNDAASRRASR